MTLNGFGPVFCIVQRNQRELQLRSCRCRKQQCGGLCVRVWCFLVTNVCNHGEHYETPCSFVHHVGNVTVNQTLTCPIQFKSFLYSLCPPNGFFQVKKQRWQSFPLFQNTLKKKSIKCLLRTPPTGPIPSIKAHVHFSFLTSSQNTCQNPRQFWDIS
jgi:hypothetical protein